MTAPKHTSLLQLLSGPWTAVWQKEPNQSNESLELDCQDPVWTQERRWRPRPNRALKRN